MFKIIAHRGASADAADNSAKAFDLAIQQQADLIETDVRKTADGVLVLEHDADIAGLDVAYNTLAKLRTAKPHLLTVAQAITQFGSLIPFCFEIKAAGLEHALIYLLRDLLPPDLWKQTEFTSFNFASAVACQKLLTELGETNSVGWLTRQWDEEAITMCQTYGLKHICPPAEAVLAKPDIVGVAHSANLAVRVWLVKTPDIVPDLNDLGVYGGTVNFPAAARQKLTTSTLN